MPLLYQPPEGVETEAEDRVFRRALTKNLPNPVQGTDAAAVARLIGRGVLKGTPVYLGLVVHEVRDVSVNLVNLPPHWRTQYANRGTPPQKASPHSG